MQVQNRGGLAGMVGRIGGSSAIAAQILAQMISAEGGRSHVEKGRGSCEIGKDLDARDIPYALGAILGSRRPWRPRFFAALVPTILGVYVISQASSARSQPIGVARPQSSTGVPLVISTSVACGALSWIFVAGADPEDMINASDARSLAGIGWPLAFTASLAEQACKSDEDAQRVAGIYPGDIHLARTIWKPLDRVLITLDGAQTSPERSHDRRMSRPIGGSPRATMRELAWLTVRLCCSIIHSGGLGRVLH